MTSLIKAPAIPLVPEVERRAAEQLSRLSRGSAFNRQTTSWSCQGVWCFTWREDRQQLAHTSRQGHLRYLAAAAGGHRMLEHRIVPHGYQGTHIGWPVQGASHPDRPAAPEGAAITIKGATPTRAASRWRLNVPNSGR